MSPRPNGSGASARLSGIVRRFGSVTALDGADLEVRPGEVHAVLGENGAGKSTLLEILGGIQRPDAGRVEIGGVAVELRSPRDAWTHGVGLVHQHFKLVPALTVLENLALGRRSAAGGWRIPYATVRAAASDLIGRTGLEAPLDAVVAELGVGERQRVEILKTLLRHPPILALDEPTAVLSPPEIDALFAMLRDLAAEGRAIVLVAHKIEEVLRVADRVTVLRQGRTMLSGPASDASESTLVAAMVGRTFGGSVPARPTARRRSGDAVAVLEDVTLRGRARPALDGVSLTVRRGEILGVAGVDGNGQRELALVLAGRRRPASGVARLPPGIGFVPQDRTREGLIADFDLVENVALALHDSDRYARGGLMRWGDLRVRAEEIRTRFDIRAPSVDVHGRTLSGGNQQRLVVGRELGLARDLLVAESPTRGLDVRSTAFVRSELVRLVEDEGGPGIVLLSTDLDEVLALADRGVVMTHGRLAVPSSAHPTREEVGALMLGSSGART